LCYDNLCNLDVMLCGWGTTVGERLDEQCSADFNVHCHSLKDHPHDMIITTYSFKLSFNS